MENEADGRLEELRPAKESATIVLALEPGQMRNLGASHHDLSKGTYIQACWSESQFLYMG